jgi:hypothetical protein
MNNKSWVIKALIIFCLIFIFGVIFTLYNTKKEPFQYFSLCVPLDIRCPNSDRHNCLSESIFEDLVTDKGKCDYLKIPSIYEASHSRGGDVVIKLPLNKVYLQIKPQYEGESTLDEVNISRGSNLSMLSHIGSNADKEPNTKIFGVDAYVKFYTEPWSDAFKRNTKGWENMTHYAFYATVVAKDKTAHLYCLESRLEKFDLNQINPRLVCNVYAVADDSLGYRYTIPYRALGQFEEINKSYSKLLKSFKYDIKH